MNLMNPINSKDGLYSIKIDEISHQLGVGSFGDLLELETQIWLIAKAEEIFLRIIYFAKDGIIVQPVTQTHDI